MISHISPYEGGCVWISVREDNSCEWLATHVQNNVDQGCQIPDLHGGTTYPSIITKTMLLYMTTWENDGEDNVTPNVHVIKIVG